MPAVCYFNKTNIKKSTYMLEFFIFAAGTDRTVTVILFYVGILEKEKLVFIGGNVAKPVMK